MKINFISKSELSDLISDPDSFRESLDDNIYIVRGYLSGLRIDFLRSLCSDISEASEPSWHPCVDDCPDYHRIHDNYPKAYVKSRQHAYYFHSWNKDRKLLEEFEEIYALKSRVGGEPEGSHLSYLENKPSDKVVSRLLLHQYPRGGGGQELHIDPVAKFARVQTIIQASERGVDYWSGGFYVLHDTYGRIDIDGLTSKGDLLLVSPDLKHGVAEIDPGFGEIQWERTDGRWIIMPIIIRSDVGSDESDKPREVQNG